MLSLEAVFWIFLIFFGLIGALRGWAKEVTATAGLVLSLFTLKTFGPFILDVFNMADAAQIAADTNIIYRRQFWVLTGIHLFITFFSYQGPTLSGAGRRLQRRDNVQDKLLGWIIGSLNGYFIVGTLYSFLEFRIKPIIGSPDGAYEFVRLLPNEGYAFDPATIQRPANTAVAIFNYLPLEFFNQNQILLPLLLVALFLVILIVII